MRFKSKIDGWIGLLLLFAVAAQLYALFAIAVEDIDSSARLLALVVVGAALALTGSVLLRTHYTVRYGELRIVSGPFFWTVPLDRITSVTASRNALSSPALSLDRLRIRYGEKKSVLVSPADKQGFLDAIGQTLA